ncbi:MAG: hypothetical protein JNL69_07795 [Bacteroidia bacterium]|nr:hypothetical protein [Bacteroidia bacterium]
MQKKLIGAAVLLLVYFFPFRWAFLEYPANINVNNTLIDGGRIEYIVYFLISLFGVLFFVFSTMTEGKGHADKH